MEKRSVQDQEFQILDRKLPSLDGEDVGIFIGTCANDKYVFLVNQILNHYISAIVVLFNPESESGRREAEELVQHFKEDLPPLPIPRRFYVCDLTQWEHIQRGGHKNSFVPYIFHLDKSLPIPDYLQTPRAKCDYSALSDFEDIPLIKDSLCRIVNAFAQSPVGGRYPVALLTGETGVGKSFAAKMILQALQEKGEGECSFIHLNCAEFGKEDMNAALFGLKGGVFTDTSHKDQSGAIEQAENGILFLDEIGTLPLELQPRLLLALDGEYHLHGSAVAKEVKCRFIFGTNENLEQAVSEGRFRLDLFNRINGLRVDLLPIRDRIAGREGMNFLNRIIKNFSEEYRLCLSRMARTLFEEFAKDYPWRGNFRELQHAFQYLRMKTEGTNIVSAHTMQELRESLEAEADTNRLPECFDKRAVPVSHSLLTTREDICAHEKVTLSFAFACAAKAPNPSAAGRLFFAGKKLSNWNKSFAAYLKRFGYKWDLSVEGHVAEEDAKTPEDLDESI